MNIYNKNMFFSCDELYDFLDLMEMKISSFCMNL